MAFFVQINAVIKSINLSVFNNNKLKFYVSRVCKIREYRISVPIFLQKGTVANGDDLSGGDIFFIYIINDL